MNEDARVLKNLIENLNTHSSPFDYTYKSIILSELFAFLILSSKWIKTALGPILFKKLAHGG